MKNEITTECFIKRAKLMHGEKYDYSNVDYKNSKTKINIFCKKHKTNFFQIPNSHTSGTGCPFCGKEKASKSITGTKEKFVELAKNKHGNRFNYSEVIYINYYTKVKILCNEHNIYFYQFPENHTRGHSGCSKCKGNSISKSNRGTIEDFIIRVKAIHGEKYDYSKVKYINQNKKIEIFCIKHNSYFSQTPANHLNGKGCHKCIESKGENKISIILNNLGVQYERQKKFETCKNIQKLQFDFYIPKFNICIEFDGIQHEKVMGFWGGEKKLLDTQKRDRIKNEWCSKNRVKLLRIRYKDSHIIESILINFLQENKCQSSIKECK